MVIGRRMCERREAKPEQCAARQRGRSSGRRGYSPECSAKRSARFRENSFAKTAKWHHESRARPRGKGVKSWGARAQLLPCEFSPRIPRPIAAPPTIGALFVTTNPDSSRCCKKASGDDLRHDLVRVVQLMSILHDGTSDWFRCVISKPRSVGSTPTRRRRSPLATEAAS